MLQLFDDCVVFVLLGVGLLSLVTVGCGLFLVGGLLSVGVVVARPCVLVLGLGWTRTGFLRYLDSLGGPIGQHLLQIMVLARQWGFLGC